MRWLAAASVLSGCVALAPSEDPARTSYDLRFAASGIDIVGAGREIGFGRAQAGAIETVSRLLGDRPEAVAVQSDCGAGRVTAARWPGGVTLNFLDGDFRGWVLSAPGPVADGGLSVGQPAPPQGARLSETSLGTEFDTGSVAGLMREGEIAVLWSGLTCFFR